MQMVLLIYIFIEDDGEKIQWLLVIYFDYGMQTDKVIFVDELITEKGKIVLIFLIVVHLITMILLLIENSI